MVTLDADPLGQSDATAQFSGGMADAARKGTKASLPGGRYLLLGQVTQPNDLILEGDGKRRSLIQPRYAASKAPAWVLGGDGAELRDIGFRGPGSRALGKRTANLEGIRIDGRCKLTDVDVQYFDSGLIFNSPVGHISLRDVVASNNYYGIDQRDGTGDHRIEGGEVNGNTYANLHIPGNVVGTAITVIRTHLGYAPHAILQTGEAPATGFLSTCTFIDARFEACGNIPIYSENFAVSGQAGIQGCTFINPGHSWTTDFRLPDRPWDYAVKAGYCGRSNVVIMGADGFRAGSSGKWLYVAQNYATWLIIGEHQGDDQVSVKAGHPEFMSRLFSSEAGWRTVA